MKSIKDELWKFRKYRKNIKEFKVIRAIGNGGFAIINLVENIKTKERYAAKTILSDKISKEQIIREIEILTRFQTSTFIKFLGFTLVDFENKNNITLFMEYAENKSLNYILQDEKHALLPVGYNNTSRQIIAIGIAYSMMILNQNLIIHRDLTPGNIFIDSNFHPKLSDFGLSKPIEIGNEFNQSISCGTLIYKSPENDHNMQYGMKNDVYSFGLILYEIFTGEFPYQEINDKDFQYEEFISKIKEKKYELKFKDFINKSIQELISKCLSINPDDRPSFEEIFNKLAFNFDDENEDDNYFLPDVDNEMINDYVETITNDKTENNNLNIIINDIIKHENEQEHIIKLLDQKIESINQKLKGIKKLCNQILKKVDENKNNIENLTKCLNDNKKETDHISNIQKEIIASIDKNSDEITKIKELNLHLKEQIKNVVINKTNNFLQEKEEKSKQVFEKPKEKNFYYYGIYAQKERNCNIFFESEKTKLTPTYHITPYEAPPIDYSKYGCKSFALANYEHTCESINRLKSLMIESLKKKNSCDKPNDKNEVKTDESQKKPILRKKKSINEI